MTWDFRSGVRHTAGPDGMGVYGAPPLRGCLCVNCLYQRDMNVWCRNCKNLGPECWYCGRGIWDAGQDGWGAYTRDVASGA